MKYPIGIQSFDKELFKGLKIDSLEKDWLEYPVFHIDFNGDDFTIPGILEKKIGRYLSMWEALISMGMTLPFREYWRKKSGVTCLCGKKCMGAIRHGRR